MVDSDRMSNIVPRVGSVVKVTTRHRSYYAHSDTPFREFTIFGTVVDVPAYWQAHAGTAFAVETGASHHPISLVSIENVVAVDYIKGKSLSTAALKNAVTMHATVAGSKGNVYTVKHSAGRWTCTCTGFEFRNQCKHIAQVREKMNG